MGYIEDKRRGNSAEVNDDGQLAVASITENKMTYFSSIKRKAHNLHMPITSVIGFTTYETIFHIENT